MDIELIENQKCNVYLTLFADPDNPVDATQFEVYGAAQNHSKNEVFTVEPTGADGQFKVVIPGLYVHKCCPWRYQIFVRNKETGNEWLATYGKIKVNDRYATVTSDKIALPEYECQYVLSNGNLVYTEQYSGVEIPSVNYAGIVNTISEHTENSDIHVTTEEKQAWNEKCDKAALNAALYKTENYIEESPWRGNTVRLSSPWDIHIIASPPAGRLLSLTGFNKGVESWVNGEYMSYIELSEYDESISEWKLIAKSNSFEYISAADSFFGKETFKYTFENCVLSGAQLKICARTKDGEIQLLSVYCCPGVGNDESGGLSNIRIPVQYEMQRKVEKYAQIEHTGDTTVHVTEEERTAWNVVSTLAPHAAFLSAAATGDWSTCKYALLQFYDVNAITGTHPCSISGYHSAEKLQELNYAAHSYGGWIEQISDSMMLLYCGKNDSFTSNDFGTFVLFPLVNTTDMAIPHSICYLNLPMQFHLEI